MGAAERPRAAGHGIRLLIEPPPPISPARRAAQAIDALRHGWPLRAAGAPVLQPVETAFGEDTGADTMLISGSRAETLKLANQRDAAVPGAPVLLRGAERFELAAACAVADPSMDLATPLKGPFQALPLTWPVQAAAALELARLAGILPAFLVSPQGAGEPQPFEPDDLAAFAAPARLRIAARVRLPLTGHENAEIVAFRSQDDIREHAAVIVGRRSAARVPLVRLHSECLTGDVFGSLRCDCGPQLDGALAAMAREARGGGWGVVLYLRQEGRGIGLINKLRAYRLQDQGFDTLDANTRLGLPAEARDFPVAARMLALLGVADVRLMTNNPAKVAAFAAAGISVAERVPLVPAEGPHNRDYLATKRDRAGHFLP